MILRFPYISSRNVGFFPRLWCVDASWSGRRWCIDTLELNSTWRLFRSETGKITCPFLFRSPFKKANHIAQGHMSKNLAEVGQKRQWCRGQLPFFMEQTKGNTPWIDVIQQYTLSFFEHGFQADGPNMSFHGFSWIFDMTFHNCIHLNLSILWISLMAVSSALATGFCGISCGRCRCLAHCTESRRHQWLRMRMDGHCWFPYSEAAIISNLGFVWSYKFKL